MTSLNISRRNIIQDCIPKDILPCIFLSYLVGIFPDDDSYFCLIIQLAGHIRVAVYHASFRNGLIHTL